jgi:hypothetical protein
VSETRARNLGRRAWLCGALSLVTLRARAQGDAGLPPTQPTAHARKARITLHTYEEADEALTPARFAESLEIAERLLDIHFSLDARVTIDTKARRLETRADRDRLSQWLTAGTIDVFGVESLRDVDDTRLYRRGVTWTHYKTPPVGPYIVLARAAPPSTLAHELGHFFGLHHVATKNNLMSYERDGGEIFTEPPQRATVLRNYAWRKGAGLLT